MTTQSSHCCSFTFPMSMLRVIHCRILHVSYCSFLPNTNTQSRLPRLSPRFNPFPLSHEPLPALSTAMYTGVQQQVRPLRQNLHHQLPQHPCARGCAVWCVIIRSSTKGKTRQQMLRPSILPDPYTPYTTKQPTAQTPHCIHPTFTTRQRTKAYH